MNSFLLCRDMIPEYFEWITLSGVPSTLFYSYIPAILLILTITFFVYENNKDKHNYTVIYLCLLAVSATLWMCTTLIEWLAAPVIINNFAWSIMGLFEMFVYIFSLCFFISFVLKKDVSLNYKIVLGVILLPILFFEEFHSVINYFNIDECNGYYNLFYTSYIYIFEIISTLFVITWGVLKVKRASTTDNKKQIIFITIAVFLFQILFTLSSIIGEATLVYGINLFGPIGLVIFVGLLSFLIVRFKAFDIKMLAAQALVWALVILIGSQFLYLEAVSPVVLILTGFTLVVAAILGLILVRSVKKEVAQREQIEQLAKSLENSNDKLAGANLSLKDTNQKIEVANRSLEEANDKLKELDLMKSEFVSLATHQIRGPLAAIKGYISLMQEGDYGKVPKKFDEPLSTVFKSTDSLSRMVTDFLDVSRIDLGQMKYEFTEFDFKDLVKEVATELKPNIDAKGLEFREKITDQACPIKADRTKLKQVLNNLVDNSSKYTKTGWLEISVEKKNNNVLFAVKDSGVGISEKTLSQLFQRFSRAKNANDSNILGTGLGLYIAKKMVEANSGKVWAESEGEGKGAQFYVEIPAVK